MNSAIVHLIRIVCVHKICSIKSLTSNVPYDSILKPFIERALNSMRAQTNDIGVAVQARIVCNGSIMIFDNVFDIYNLCVSFTDGRQKGNVVLHDVVLTFSARGVNLLDSAYTMDYVGMYF